MMRNEWVESFLKTKFFSSCVNHEELRENKMNFFCIDCNQSICQNCLSSSAHDLHQQLQIRRYVYQEVVRVDEIEKHINCSQIQSYLSNLAKIVFLNPRPRVKISKSESGGAACEACERSLQEPYRYCSIACKVSVVAEKGKDKSPSPPLMPHPIPELNDAESVVESIDQHKRGRVILDSEGIDAGVQP
ncbi:protein RGF1 INDUCIBLE TRANSCRIPTION FACTOR 1-like isoform X2 [Macadamia integrifolia]|uniref:protein RGF1 INDUCIBLE TRANSCRIPTION FACTOR 1-like isoform X2 n=1 Tax=Macadamia integrifolia TaxID=60698 RepID=UPI001C4E5DF8|nr:protein RGF1 INDUCIBLE TRANSCRIPTION FACTOR 1-like isoform X2 [Macadamia integrifolia]